jgi:hypothetical protein
MPLSAPPNPGSNGAIEDIKDTADLSIEVGLR